MADTDYKLYFFESKKTGKKRNTGVLAKDVDEARSKLKRPAPDDAKLYKKRSMTPEEKKKANKGEWVTGGPEGPKRRKQETGSNGFKAAASNQQLRGELR